jgi:membrane-associated phospholipid phosphatase
MRILVSALIILSASLPVSAQYKPATNNLKADNIYLSDPYSENVPPNSPDLYLFGNIGNNVVNSFKGDNLYYHLAGIASTAIIVSTNTDYYVHKFFYKHEYFGEAALPIIRAGIYIPFVTGGSLYAYGKLSKDDRAVAASFAVLQSSLIAFLYNSLLKAVTGRPNPDWQHNTDMKELSKTFRFGFMRGGIFWGWPSGHTSSAMAVVSSLTSFYADKTWLKIAGYSLVAYMMFGVISLHQGGMHWFSDAVAAALMSYAIGSTVGKYYRSKFQPADNAGGNSPGMEVPVLNLRIAF